MKELTPLFVGFLLTTVAGGALGSYFQRRSWSHQNEIQAAAQRTERAILVFEEISRLLDRRLYRMRRLYWSLRDETSSSPSQRSQARMDEYVACLYDWNDNINRNLALIEQYFGQPMRQRFDNEIGEDMVQAGARLEALWKEPSAQRDKIDDLEPAFNRLAGLIYAYDVDMIETIQAKQAR